MVSAARVPDAYFLLSHGADVNRDRAADLLHGSGRGDAHGLVADLVHGVRDHGRDFLKRREIVRACRSCIGGKDMKALCKAP